MRYFNPWGSLILILLSGIASAQDLGVIGQMYAIEEVDLLAHIEGQLKTTEMQTKIAEMQEDIKLKVANINFKPKPVALTKATATKEYMFDPSTMVMQDLTDHAGKVFYKAGTRVNPLAQAELPAPLLFIDGDDEQQLKFVEEYEKLHEVTVDLILTNGAPFRLSQSLNRAVYFDQGGAITSHFKIEHIPAVVTQQQQELKIMEVAI